MKITNTTFSPQFKANVNFEPPKDSNKEEAPAQIQTQTQGQVSKEDKKTSVLDKFQSSVKNSADLNDTIQVPRTIFKGYMAFFASTTLVTLAMFTKNKFPKITTGMNVASALTALWGTYSFVRPYLIRDTKNK